jgi:hypothetical protein
MTVGDCREEARWQHLTFGSLRIQHEANAQLPLMKEAGLRNR